MLIYTGIKTYRHQQKRSKNQTYFGTRCGITSVENTSSKIHTASIKKNTMSSLLMVNCLFSQVDLLRTWIGDSGSACLAVRHTLPAHSHRYGYQKWCCQNLSGYLLLCGFSYYLLQKHGSVTDRCHGYRHRSVGEWVSFQPRRAGHFSSSPSSQSGSISMSIAIYKSPVIGHN